MPVKKKKRPEIRKKPVSGVKRPASKPDRDPKDRWKKAEIVWIGGDISLSSISLAGLARTQDGKLRVGAISKRWTKDVDYFVRMKEAAKAHEFVHDLMAELRISAELEQMTFAIEEAVAISYLKKGDSSWIKQQLQISGAFIGGLLRWGYNDIVEIQANKWRGLVAADLGITTHASKWNTEDVLKLPSGFHAQPKGIGKFRAQQWVMKFHPKWDGHWPDIVTTKDGQVPRPESSKAAGVQSDDRYEALAMAEWLRREIRRG